MNDNQHQLFEFGPFRLDEAERMLLRDGQPVLLPPKVFDTLVVLVRNRGHLLEKDRLMKEIWPDSFVEEVNLAVNISALRKVLGDVTDGRSFIETVPKRGYRFVGELSQVPQAPDELIIENRIRARIVTNEKSEQLSSDTETDLIPAKGAVQSERRHLRRLVLVGTVTASAILIAAFSVRFWRMSHQPVSPAEPRIESLAVLPFKPINTAARDEYLELGLADDLINRLSGLKQVVVRPTSTVRRYTNVDQDPIGVGKELRVDAVLEGNIQKLGDRVKVTAAVWSVSQGKPLWSGQYDENFKDMFTLEDSISTEVARSVIPQLSGEDKKVLAARPAENPQAHDAYLKGIYFWNKRTEESLNRAIAYFQQAIDAEPNFARAYSGIADCYVLLYDYNALAPSIAVPKAKAAAQKAIEIDNTLAEPHSSLGYLEALYDWNWPEAEKEFKTSIALNPHYATGHHWYALLLAFTGRTDESLREIDQAQQLDPLSLIINSNRGRILYYRREYDQAIAQLKYTLQLDQNFWGAHYNLAQVYETTGRYQEWISEYAKSFELDGDKQLAAMLDQGYAAAGYRGALLMHLKHLEERAKHQPVSPYALAELYARLGNKEQALQWLEKAANNRSSWIVQTRINPKFDGLRSDQRFRDLLKREGLIS